MDFSQFVSELVATVIGVGLAIWGALWLERKSKSREDSVAQIKKTNRAKRVLGLIKKELDENLAILQSVDDNIPTTFNLTAIECWRALSDGGELQSIDDPELLSSISTAYSSIVKFDFLYKKYFEMRFFPGSNVYVALQRVLENHTLKAKHDSALAVAAAIKEIAKKTAPIAAA